MKAESIDLPEEELAKESVMPKFDPPISVKNKNVITDRKTDFGVYFGWNFTEPIYHQNKMGINLGYHSDEYSAWMINFAKWFPGRNSQYTDLLKKKSLDFTRAPDIEYSLWGLYMIKNYYGKMSMTKRGTMNMFLYPVFGLGVTKYVHKVYFGGAAGIGARFYFSKTFSLNAELRFQYSGGPNPFLGSGDSASPCSSPSINETCPKPSFSQFGDKWTLSNIMDVGIGFLF